MATVVKVAAIILTVKPELIEIEILTEDEEKQQPKKINNRNMKEPY